MRHLCLLSLLVLVSSPIVAEAAELESTTLRELVGDSIEHPSFEGMSKDGGTILFQDRGDAYKTYRVDVDSGELTRLGDDGVAAQVYGVAPDGAFALGHSPGPQDPPGTPGQAALLLPTGTVFLDVPPEAERSAAHASSSDGRVIVGDVRFVDPESERLPARWTDGALELLDLGGSGSAIAVSVDGGVVVGTVWLQCEGCARYLPEAFVWIGDEAELLPHPDGMPACESWYVSEAGDAILGGCYALDVSDPNGLSNAYLQPARWERQGSGWVPRRLARLPGPRPDYPWDITTPLSATRDGSLAAGWALGIPPQEPVIFTEQGEVVRTFVDWAWQEYGLEFDSIPEWSSARVSENGRTLVVAGWNAESERSALLVFLPGPELPMTVEPRHGDEPIDLSHRRPLSVVLFGSADVDLTQLDLETLRFGSGAARPLASRGLARALEKNRRRRHFRDLDGDGWRDVVLRFDRSEAGIEPGDTLACLRGEVAGAFFESCDEIEAVAGEERRDRRDRRAERVSRWK